MASKRDKIKQLNRKEPENITITKKESIIDDQVKEFERVEEEKEASKPLEINVMQPENTADENRKEQADVPSETSGALINVIDKSHVGRPKKYEGVYKPISARLKNECYVHARTVGGMYGGMNAYINYLIEQDMKKK